MQTPHRPWNQTQDLVAIRRQHKSLQPTDDIILLCGVHKNYRTDLVLCPVFFEVLFEPTAGMQKKGCCDSHLLNLVYSNLAKFRIQMKTQNFYCKVSNLSF